MQHTPDDNYRVNGFVLNRESGAGIPRLLVNLYDWDLDAAELPGQTRELAEQLRAVQLTDTLSSFDEGEELDGAEDAAALWEALGEAWMKEVRETGDGRSLDPYSVLGQRIGSTLTREDGSFEFEFDPLELASDDPHRRPDLILAVTAPEDSLLVRREGPDGGEVEPRIRPFAASPFSRILHISLLGKGNAGRREAYVVRLLPEQLHRFRLDAGRRHSEDLLSPGHLRELVRSERARTEGLRAVRADRWAGRSLSLADERSAATSLVERLARGSAMPRDGYISPLRTDFDLRDVIRDGILDFIDVFPIPEAPEDDVWSTLVHLSEEEVRDLGGSADAIEDGGELDTTLCAVLSRTGSPDSLLRSRELLSEVWARRAVEGLATEEEVEEEEPEETDDVAPTSRDEVEADIVNRLSAIVAQLPEDAGAEGEEGTSTADPDGLAGELERIKRIVDRLEMSGGPANVVAARNVNVLQLGFSWVWTSLFDQDFEGQVRRLYDTIVKLKEQRGVPLSESELDEVTSSDDLHRLLEDIRRAASVASDEPVPPIVSTQFPFVTRDRWARLDEEGRSALVDLASRHEVVVRSGAEAERESENGEAPSEPGEPPRTPARRIDSSSDGPRVRARRTGTSRERRAHEILEEHIASERNPIAGADELVSDLEERLTEPYAFDVFSPGHVNYGIMLTYRQEWSPVTYQVGELVDTLPLAPGETRKFRVKRGRTERVRRKTVDTRLRESTRSRESTRRLETEALRKTTQAINNTIQTEGSFNIGIGEIGATTNFSQNFTEESRRLQKTFRELTRKSTDKVRREHEVTVETETEAVVEETETHTISNPNNEITITYLMYELERRYQVASRLNQVQPVICVALEMPAPHEITEGWLLEHSWVIGESLLDPDLEPLLGYLEEDRAGDLLELEVRRTTLEEQRARTAELEREYDSLARLARQRREAVVDYMEALGVAKAGGGSKFGRAFKAIMTGGASEAIPGPEDVSEMSTKVIKAKREAAEQALEYLEDQLQSKGRALSDAQEALAEATEKYAAILKGHAAREAAITRLQVHVRNNIHHYMHRIWSHQHPDSRFFSLYDMEVPYFPPDDSAYTLRVAGEDERGSDVPGARTAGTDYVLEFRPPEPPADYDDIPKRKLGEIADVDRPLGFRGNYIVLPLRKCCQLTDAMMFPYVDTYTGVRDPAFGRGYTGEELLEYAREVWPTLDASERDRLGPMIVEALVEHPNATQEVTLPTGQLFMESLKGDTTLLEDFKLAHRGLDVLRVEEAVRADRIDSLRRAARVVTGDLDLDPADVEKWVVVRGDDGADVDV